MEIADSREIDVFGIGNAMVDILARVDHDFIREHALTPGSMTLVDAEKQGALLRFLEHRALELRSGGSAANTIVAVAQSGGRGYYSGKVARDSHGEFYRQDLLEAGIHFDVHPAQPGVGSTGSCLVLTTPDAERTMCTHLGVSGELGPEDIDLARLARSKTVYIEGYLWEPSRPRQACILAMEEAHRQGVRVALTFSDFFLVDRFEDDFRWVVREYCDIVFCNAEEARRFCNDDSLEACIERIGQWVELAFVTDGPEGCLVAYQGRSARVPAFPAQAVDTVGAGDAFAGGVLYGLTHGYSPSAAARWGHYLAGRVVQIYGARLDRDSFTRCHEILQEGAT